MKTELTTIRIKILFVILHDKKRAVKAATIAQALGVSKSTISRALEYFQKENVVKKEKLQLTPIGEGIVTRYWQQKEALIEWLVYSADMSRIEAEEEALGIILNTKERTLDAWLRSIENGTRNNILCEMEGFREKCIDYLLDDGEYDISFTIYKNNVQKYMQVSMANDGFHHPATMYVKNGIGIIRLESKKVVRTNSKTNGLFGGRVNKIAYLQGHHYVDAVHEGNVWRFPISCMSFTYNKGENSLMGSTMLQFSCSIGNISMPESVALFTMILTV